VLENFANDRKLKRKKEIQCGGGMRPTARLWLARVERYDESEFLHRPHGCIRKRSTREHQSHRSLGEPADSAVLNQAADDSSRVSHEIDIMVQYHIKQGPPVDGALACTGAP